MDSRQMMNEQLKKKFHGKTQVESKYIPRLPESAEREYIREMNRLFSEAIKPVFADCLPELIQILRQAEKNEASPFYESKRHTDASSKAKTNEEKRAKTRREALAAFAPLLERWFDKVFVKLKQTIGLYGAAQQLNTIANANRKLTVKEWKKAIGKTLGINILEDYYDGSFYSEILEQWVKENVDLINTIPKDMLDQMRKIILEDYLQGKPITQIAKDIQNSYSMSKSHARLIARDQMGKLNCQITKYQQQSCGVNKYIWRTAGDGRVRKDHKALDKKVFDWDHPPIVDRRSGRRCHPGQDYQCRCIAVPILEFEKLDLPVDGTASADIGKRR